MGEIFPLRLFSLLPPALPTRFNNIFITLILCAATSLILVTPLHACPTKQVKVLTKFHLKLRTRTVPPLEVYLEVSKRQFLENILELVYLVGHCCDPHLISIQGRFHYAILCIRVPSPLHVISSYEKSRTVQPSSLPSLSTIFHPEIPPLTTTEVNRVSVPPKTT